MASYISDLHCHSTLFSYNRRYSDTWYERYFPIFPAQGNFAQLARGKVRVIMLSLYPIEQGFVSARSFGFGTGNITDLLARLIVAIPKERADEIQNYEHDYYDDLIKELAFLQKSAMPVTHNVFVNAYWKKKFQYRVVSSFNDLKGLLEMDDELNPGVSARNTIAVVLTIEGAHALGVGQRNMLTTTQDEVRAKLHENISKLKKLGPVGEEGAWCPFFITLSHHYWNQLGGHAVSLWRTVRKVLDQRLGINDGITELGEFVVEELLDNSNGKRRILIDSAHMSHKLRKWYFNYLELRSDNIPVIFSHIAVNGKATMAESEMHGNPDVIHDVADELYKESIEFNPWDDFISDEEIMIVHRSGGIIGLILDQRIMMGKAKFDEIKKRARFKTFREKRKIWIQPFIDQILHIARHILNETGETEKLWDNISLGTDFNGMITPIKPFKTAVEMPVMKRILFRELKKRAVAEVALAGKSDDEIRAITDKIMWKNNLLFLEKYFVYNN
jgi:microsomal dipeptidase-like Zn-dependent dipeptidase